MSSTSIESSSSLCSEGVELLLILEVGDVVVRRVNKFGSVICIVKSGESSSSVMTEDIGEESPRGVLISILES